MECYNCGIILGQEKVCPNCGADLRIYRKFVGISNYLYNQALAKAKTRDLSGAIADLRLSLQYNKVNTNARNLLGLIYYEMGEGVAAVREWLISKGYQAEENRASVYLEQTKKDPAEKEKINQLARKYNQVVAYCHQDSLDLAVIQLKKILAGNAKFVKGWQLLALVYIRNGELEQARKALHKAEAGDAGNPTTSRYLKEVAEQIRKGGGKKAKKASLFITHGGMNSLNEAIYYGVPLIVIPQDADHPFNALRVAELNLGITLKMRNAKHGLYEMAKQVIEDEEIEKQMNCAQIKQQSAGGVQKAADYVEAL